jgi:hypothetical protein
MYFQTGQVIFVLEWPKGEFVSILASVCVWTKSLMCKDAVNRDSTIQSDVRRFCLQVKRISSSLSAVRTIEPSRSDDHLSTVPSVQTTCHPVRMQDKPSIIRPDDVSLRPDPPLCREGSIQLPFVQTFQQHVRTPLSTRSVSDFFPSSKKGKIDRPSRRCGTRPNTRLLKARIAIQISPSGPLIAMVRTGVHQRRKLPIRLQLSERLPIIVRTRTLQIWKLRVEE